MGGRGSSSSSTADSKIINTITKRYKDSVNSYYNVNRLDDSAYWRDNVKNDIGREAFNLYKNRDFTTKDETRIYNEVLKRLRRYEE